MKTKTKKLKRGRAVGSSALVRNPAIRMAVEGMNALHGLTEEARKVDKAAMGLLESLTADPKPFPKAVVIGTVLTDIATITIDGGSSKPIEIVTGADGDYTVFGDNYKDGLPGRIIIEIAHPVRMANTKLSHAAGQKGPNANVQ